MEITFLMPPLEASPYFWLIKIGTTRVGVHKFEGWCMQLDGRTVILDSEDKCMPLAPILEIEAKKLFGFLKAAEAYAPDYAEVLHRFPKELLLKHVFHTSFSGYWPDRALAWLIDDSNLQPLFVDELRKFIDNKVMPQGARQRAAKIVKAIKGQGNGQGNRTFTS